MKIPNKLKIKNITYTVKKMQNGEAEDYYGKTYSAKQEIKIAFDNSEERIEDTFFHELIHAILNEGKYGSLSDDEKFVHYLGTTLYQVLKDNKLLK